MPQRPPSFTLFKRDKKAAHREQDARRGSASQRLYDHRWRKARLNYLAAHPLCVYCMKDKRVTPATVVDHIIPHRGDYQLFWDVHGNWQGLCCNCHSSRKQREERRAHG